MDVLRTYDKGPIHIEKIGLSNGLTIVHWEDHRAPVFAYQTWFSVGSRHEQPGRTGMAHLFEHLMFKATENMPEGEFDRVMERLGAQTNAATWVDWTYYREKLPAGNLDLTCCLEADRMEHMILNEGQLESEREVVVNERLLRVDNDPEGALYEALYALAYGKTHPHGWPTIGWMEDIRAITLSDCLAFYERYYAPNNATIVVVGDVGREELCETIERHYGHMASQVLPEEKVPAKVTLPGEVRETLRLPVAAERGIYAWHGLAADDPDHAALDVLDEMLTGGISSRLHRALVTEGELATGVGGWTSAWRHPGLYEIGVTMRPSIALARAEQEIDRTVVELCEVQVENHELEKARNGLETDLHRGFADTGNRARALGEAEMAVGDFAWALERADQLAAVTAEDVQRVARRVVGAPGRAVVVGVPEEEN